MQVTKGLQNTSFDFEFSVVLFQNTQWQVGLEDYASRFKIGVTKRVFTWLRGPLILTKDLREFLKKEGIRTYYVKGIRNLSIGKYGMEFPRILYSIMLVA